MYEIRPITTDEWTQAKELYMQHSKLQRGKILKADSDLDIWFAQGVTIVGAFSNSELVAFMTYKLLAQLPITRIGNIYIRPGLSNLYFFNDPTHPIPKILDFILNISESMGYHTWMYSRANMEVYSKLEEKNQDLLRCCSLGYDIEKKQYRYDKYIEELIPPHGVSKFDGHNTMFNLGSYEKA